MELERRATYGTTALQRISGYLSQGSQPVPEEPCREVPYAARGLCSNFDRNNGDAIERLGEAKRQDQAERNVEKKLSKVEKWNLRCFH